MLLFVLALFIITRLAAERLLRTHHAQKTSFFLRYPIQPSDIVFLGDSITDGARWDELFPGLPVKNRGINGDTTQGVLNRLEDILTGQPRAIFLLIGTNDLPWYLYMGVADIVDIYEKILARCKTEAPETQVFVQSILPRHRNYARRIRQINARLQALAETYGYTYIDLFPHFADFRGGLLKEFTNDHLHLLAPGYARWVEVIAPHVEKFRKQ